MNQIKNIDNKQQKQCTANDDDNETSQGRFHRRTTFAVTLQNLQVVVELQPHLMTDGYRKVAEIISSTLSVLAV